MSIQLSFSWVLTLGFALLPAFQGCNAGKVASSNDSDVMFPVPKGDVAIEGYYQAAANAVCSLGERCRFFGASGLMSNGVNCVTYYAQHFKAWYDLAGALDEGRLAWDAEAMGTCLTDYAQTKCGRAEPFDLYASYPCLSAVANAKQGAACRRSDECTDGNHCVVDVTCPGTCSRGAGEGDACQSDRDCQIGMYCYDDWMDDSMHCKRQSTEGETCGEEEPPSACADGLICAFTADSDFTGTCRKKTASKLLAENRSCSDEGFSTVRLCDFGLVCSTIWTDDEKPVKRKRCVAILEAGSDCVRDDGARDSVCSMETYCDAKENFGVGHCVTRVAVGEHCDSENSRSCVLGSSCEPESQTCQPVTLGADGDECKTDKDCVGLCNLTTESGVCTSVGSACFE